MDRLTDYPVRLAGYGIRRLEKNALLGAALAISGLTALQALRDQAKVRPG